MLKNVNLRRPILYILLLFLFLLASSCSRKEKSTAAAMVVVYASSDVKLIRNGKELPLVVGNLVRKGDQIHTGNGGVDLQGADGSLVRIREYSKLSVSDVVGRSGEGNTELHLDSGALLAKVRRESAKSKFEVSTPTAIASVRGTAFTVEVSEGEAPRVRVLKGAVALSPQPEILKEFSEKEIQASPQLQKLYESLKGREVVLESETEGSLSPDVNDIVVLLNERIVPGAALRDTTGAAEKATQSLDKIGKDASIKQEGSPITEKESAELETLAGVDKKLVDRALATGAEGEGGANTPAADGGEAKTAQGTTDASATGTGDKKSAEREEIRKSILTDYNENISQALVTIQKNAEAKGIKNDADIRKYYSVLEEIVLADGEIEKGAIVAQMGDTLILHSAKGVRRLEKKDINYIDYHNFDIKDKPGSIR